MYYTGSVASLHRLAHTTRTQEESNLRTFLNSALSQPAQLTRQSCTRQVMHPTATYQHFSVAEFHTPLHV